MLPARSVMDLEQATAACVPKTTDPGYCVNLPTNLRNHRGPKNKSVDWVSSPKLLSLSLSLKEIAKPSRPARTPLLTVLSFSQPPTPYLCLVFFKIASRSRVFIEEGEQKKGPKSKIVAVLDSNWELDSVH